MQHGMNPLILTHQVTPLPPSTHTHNTSNVSSVEGSKGARMRGGLWMGFPSSCRSLYHLGCCPWRVLSVRALVGPTGSWGKGKSVNIASENLLCSGKPLITQPNITNGFPLYHLSLFLKPPECSSSLNNTIFSTPFLKVLNCFLRELFLFLQAWRKSWQLCVF